MIQATVIADSRNEFGNRITTMVVTFPRIILAEFNTHRMFSRNSASSRAIPFEKMMKSVEENPFIPIAWQKHHKGMQGTDYHEGTSAAILRRDWLSARNEALAKAKELYELGVTKQLCNRLLEPFMWHTVIVTATEWENFFALRCPQYHWRTGTIHKVYRSRKDIAKFQRQEWTKEEYNDPLWLKVNQGQAEIHMMALAEAMWDAYNESVPKQLKADEWHIPFGDGIGEITLESVLDEINYCPSAILDDIDFFETAKINIATARCARVSYTVVGEEGKPADYAADIKLHDRLAASGHASPFEHIAQTASGRHANFIGFKQYRTILEENGAFPTY